MTIQRPSPWLCRAPLIATLAIICLLNGFSLIRMTPAPRNPWEAIEIVDAWRSLAGLPVHEFSRDGHATYMDNSPARTRELTENRPASR